MVRTLPAVPVLAGENHVHAPLWIEDLAAALAEAVTRPGIAGMTLELAGPDRVDEKELFERMSAITGRSPARLPVPELIASLGARLGDLLHIDIAITPEKLGEAGGDLAQGSVEDNALEAVLGVTPTPLDEGLRKLADALPEQLPSQGVGAFKRKRFWALIKGCTCSADELFRRFCDRFGEILPIKVGAEPGTPEALQEGATLTFALPVRGHIQVRVEEIGDRRVTLLTLAGHPLAGAVEFSFDNRGDNRGDGVRFMIEVCDRAANRVDQLVMRAVGDKMQNANWRQVVRRVVKESGGAAPSGVFYEAEELGDEEAERVEARLEELVIKRKREHGGVELCREAT
jgi:NADH dehydrogenase